MNYDDTDDEIVRALLRRNDTAVEEDSEDLDFEQLTLLIEGRLNSDEAAQLLGTLDRDERARQTVSAAMRLDEEAIVPIRPTASFAKKNMRWLTFAIAASLLLVATWVGVRRSSSKPLLAERRAYEENRRSLLDGDFKGVRTRLEASRSDGVDSPRLRNLQAQAMLEIPAETSLAVRGDLPSLGYEIDGVVSRGPISAAATQRQAEALALLSGGGEEAASHLNRGYLLLRMEKLEDALAVFVTATAQHPDDSLAWLGRGLAEYALDDFESAAASFKKAARLDPKSLAAAVNLAVTLTDLGDFGGASQTWESALALEPSAEVRRQIEEQLTALRSRIREGSDR